MNEPLAPADEMQSTRIARRLMRPWQRLRPIGKAIAGLAAVGAVLGGLAGYLNFYRALHEPVLPKAIGEAPHLSIVVLPFINDSGDAAQEYIADAITNDLIVGLSKIKPSFVIGRGTSFSYKGKSVDAVTVANSLHVKYVLQGTAARIGNKFHVTVQLVDGATGANLWANILDVDRENVDDVRKDIVSRIALNMNFQLIELEAKKSSKKEEP